MSKNNDNRIMSLRAIIADKRKELKKEYQKFNPITTCILELDGVKYNLHTLSISDVSHLLVKLSILKDKCTELREQGIGITYLTYSGFNIDDWISDLKSLIQTARYRNTEKELKSAESRLAELLSDEKKTELEIVALEELLNSKNL